MILADGVAMGMFTVCKVPAGSFQGQVRGVDGWCRRVGRTPTPPPQMVLREQPAELAAPDVSDDDDMIGELEAAMQARLSCVCRFEGYNNERTKCSFGCYSYCCR